MAMRQAARSIVLAMWLLAVPAVALAHQSGVALPDGEAAIVYVYEDHNSPSVWQETNGKASDGVYGRGSHRRAGTPPMGLHVRGVCYGTFTTAQVDDWNRTFCGSTASAPYDVFSYLPFDGTETQCAALAREIESTCDVCTSDACRLAEGCDELCAAGFDGGIGPCVVEEAWFPPDTHLIGPRPAYGIPDGTCHAG